MTAFPNSSRQLQVRSPEFSGGILLAEYPFWLQYSLQSAPSDWDPIFPTRNWKSPKTSPIATTTPIEIHIWFLLISGCLSSRFPIRNPAVRSTIQIARNTTTSKTGRILSTDAGHGLSPKTKIHKAPAAVPATIQAISAEIMNPGMPNRIV